MTGQGKVFKGYIIILILLSRFSTPSSHETSMTLSFTRPSAYSYTNSRLNDQESYLSPGKQTDSLFFTSANQSLPTLKMSGYAQNERGQGMSHATAPSKLSEGVQRQMPKSLEHALPESVRLLQEVQNDCV